MIISKSFIYISPNSLTFFAIPSTISTFGNFKNIFVGKDILDLTKPPPITIYS